MKQILNSNIEILNKLEIRMAKTFVISFFEIV
jgi:hypothetical protein